jgi:hypothetical protein
VAVDQHGRIHGTRRRAGHALYLEPRLFEQTVEHAPGECAMGTASLQGKINEDWLAFDCQDSPRYLVRSTR